MDVPFDWSIKSIHGNAPFRATDPPTILAVVNFVEIPHPSSGVSNRPRIGAIYSLPLIVASTTINMELTNKNDRIFFSIVSDTLHLSKFDANSLKFVLSLPKWHCDVLISESPF